MLLYFSFYICRLLHYGLLSFTFSASSPLPVAIIAIIAVVVILVVLIIIAVGTIVYMRRRAKAQNNTVSLPFFSLFAHC